MLDYFSIFDHLQQQKLSYSIFLAKVGSKNIKGKLHAKTLFMHWAVEPFPHYNCKVDLTSL